jgi:predicted small secreted protein
MKKLMAVIALMFAAVVITGCNTVEGMGRDIERGGEKLQNQAR